MTTDRHIICPQPLAWERLRAVASNAVAEGETFPKPLILAGWTFSTDADKRQRWEETMSWLRERDLEHLIESEVGGAWYHG